MPPLEHFGTSQREFMHTTLLVFFTYNSPLRDNYNYVIGWLRPNVTEDAKLGIAFPAAGESQRCIQKESCQPNFWSIDLPRNGKYKVELVLGDTSIPEQWISVELNGEVLLNCVQVPQGSLYTIVKEVDVQNNMLKVSSTSSNPSCENQRTSLQFFKVTEL